MRDEPTSQMPDGFVARLIGGLVALVARRPRMTLLLALLLTGLAGWYSTVGLRINTSTTDMISPDVPFRQHALDYRAAFPVLEDQLIVVLDAPSADRAELAAARLAEILRAQPRGLTAVAVPAADDYFHRVGLLFLNPVELDDLSTRLASAQAALGGIAQAPNLVGLADMLDLVLGNVGDRAPAELDAMLAAMAETTGDVAAGRPALLPWSQLVGGDAFARAGSRAFVTARPEIAQSGFGRGRPAMNAVRTSIAQLQQEEVGQGVTVRVTGAVALRQAELDTVAASAGLATLLSFALVALVLSFGMRSARLIAAVLITLLIGLTLNSGLAALAVGQLNLISITFAVMFFGLGDDFGSHLSLRYQEELRRGANPVTAIVIAAKGTGPALVLSTVCATIGFVSFVPTDYRGLAEFGIISGLGMSVAFLSSITVLPALIVLFKPGPGAARIEAEDKGFAAFLEKNTRPLLAGILVVTVGAAMLVPSARLDVNPLNLQDPAVEVVATYRDLAMEPTTSPYAINVLAPGLEEAQALGGKLRDLPGVGGVRTLASFVPKDQEAKLPILDGLALAIGPGLAPSGPIDPPDAAALARAVATLKAALDAYAAAPQTPPAAAAEATRFAAALATLPADDPQALARLDRALTGSLPGLLEKLRLGLEITEPVTLADIPPSIAERWIAVDGRYRLEVQPDRDISDSRDMATFAQPILEIAPTATGAPVTVTEASRIVKGAFGEATALTLVAIAAVLFVVLRNVTGIFLVIFPLSIAALWTLAASAALDQPFNFANVIVIPLLFGLGVSSCIHMVSRGLELAKTLPPGRSFGMDLLVTSTPRAVLVSTLTTSTAFATLAISDHRGLSSMGVLLAIALAFSIVVALIVLPSLMIEWRRLRSGRTGA